MKKLQKFSRVFYLVVLSLTIPFYLLLYGASGHRFRLETEDAIWMLMIILAIIFMLTFLLTKQAAGSIQKLVKVLGGLILPVTLFGGLKVFVYIVGFQFGSDIGLLTRTLSYAIPFLFVISNVAIIVGLFAPKRVE